MSYLPDLLNPLPDAAPPIDEVDAARPVMDEKSEKLIATRDLNNSYIFINNKLLFPLKTLMLLRITAPLPTQET